MENRLHPVLSIRIFGGGKCFGPGIAELLRRVDAQGSLRAAAKDMGMAYSKAWTITKNAESELGFPLLRSQTGGKKGGGAVLTDKARRLLDAYDRYCERLRAYGDAAFREEFSFLDDE